MKKTKVLVSFFIIFFGFLFIGESYQFYLNGFERNFSHTTMYLQDYIEEDEMVKDILDTAKKNNVEIFTLYTDIKSSLLQEIIIYGTSGVKSDLNKNYDIHENRYNSLLTGTTEIKFKELKNIENIKNQNDFYLIGDINDAKNFKLELINKYAGNVPKAVEGAYPFKEIYATWLLAGILILLLSVYDVIFQKKENSIKISLGESINIIVIKNIVIDILSYLGISILSILLLYKSTNVFFKIDITIKFGMAFLIINSLLYISLYFNNLKDMLIGVKISKKVLTMTYVLKFITILITTIILSGNIAVIFEGYKFYKQRSFFEEYKEYSYVNLTYKMKLNSNGKIEDNINKSMRVQEKFYNKFYDDFNAIDLVNISLSNTDYKMILASKNIENYLKENIEELKHKKLDKEYYFLIPNYLKENKEVLEELEINMEFNERRKNDYTYENVFYEGENNIISIDEMYPNGSELVKNPVIIYKNKFNSKGSKKPKIINYRNVMYKIDDNKFNSFLKENNLENQIVSKTNVLEKYLHQLEIVKRVTFISFILVILLLFLEMILIRSILMLEYEVNAIELSIKKVLGYNIFQKNKKILIITMGVTAVSIIMSVILGGVFNIGEGYYILISGILIFIIEVFTILFYIKKLESVNLNKILKGGNLR